MQVSSVASESAFSTSGRTMASWRKILTLLKDQQSPLNTFFLKFSCMILLKKVQIISFYVLCHLVYSIWILTLLFKNFKLCRVWIICHKMKLLVALEETASPSLFYSSVLYVFYKSVFFCYFLYSLSHEKQRWRLGVNTCFINLDCQ